ncbi:Methyltransferase domain-containing protein [Candidatus Thermokryptus mobilis]|uniref:Methyltransferase domain-containing protein n=1 Tax=Candidatus Thermokryptus mobilis TaxID=1643428 RepID=A0A0S4N9Y8_9BACT|nr:class I SAM-dependent methyltransferase [Candidatus Thermokryptus mobilis]CUU08135.1 Methyltransferase domain-containing protein [Candidatus Thermokryptus mobilis]
MQNPRSQFQTTQEEREFFNFDLFSEQKEYQEVNEKFIDKTFPNEIIENEPTILDIACGTGLVTSILLKKVNGAKCKIIGIDPNPASIQIAKNKLKGYGETKIEFYECYAQEILNLIPPESVDIVYFCNAIHEIPTDEAKQESLNAIATVLKHNGKLFVNSTFTKESYTQDTVKYWGLLKLYAFQYLGRKRDKNAQTFEILSVEDYRMKIENSGLVVDKIESVRVELSEKAMLAISEYDAFIYGVFIDMEDTDKFTLQQKSEALKFAVRKVTSQAKEKDANLNPFARNWIELSCRKP